MELTKQEKRKKFENPVDKPHVFRYTKHRSLRQRTNDGGIAQLARAFGSYPKCHWFKSSCRYQKVLGGASLPEPIRPVGQVVKTPPFHGGNTGSSPVRVTIWRHSSAGRALASHARGHRFEFCCLHQTTPNQASWTTGSELFFCWRDVRRTKNAAGNEWGGCFIKNRKRRAIIRDSQEKRLALFASRFSCWSVIFLLRHIPLRGWRRVPWSDHFRWLVRCVQGRGRCGHLPANYAFLYMMGVAGVSAVISPRIPAAARCCDNTRAAANKSDIHVFIPCSSFFVLSFWKAW